jgi:hypothetical protein
LDLLFVLFSVTGYFPILRVCPFLGVSVGTGGAEENPENPKILKILIQTNLVGTTFFYDIFGIKSGIWPESWKGRFRHIVLPFNPIYHT